MTPVFCRVKHDPEAGAYGDCVRACVATILNIDAEEVPHFAHDNCDGHAMQLRMREFLTPRNLVPWNTHFGPENRLDEILFMMEHNNPTAPYILFGSVEGGGDHVVVCQGGKIVHNPSWYPTPIVGPGSHGFWSVMVIAVL